MRKLARGINAAAVVILLAGGISAATGVSAGAAPSAQASCLGSPRSFSTDSNYRWPANYSSVLTTTNCADINVKPKSGMWVQACFSDQGYCNAATWITGGTWGTAATDVADGTRFFLHFDRPTSGSVDY